MPKTSTPYQPQYLAWLLSRCMGADSADLLASTQADTQVDLNPHQVEALESRLDRKMQTTAVFTIQWSLQ